MSEFFNAAGSKAEGDGGPGWAVPESMRKLGRQLVAALDGVPGAAGIVEGCLTNTWTTSMRWATPVEADGAGGADGPAEVFVLTGDIPAMWLRDSTAQVRPYLALAAAGDAEMYEVIAGVSRRQIRCVEVDAYSNSFNDGPTGEHGDAGDEPAPGPWVWEQKYEVDSLCAPLQLGYALWRATGRAEHLDESFHRAAKLIVRLWRVEQEHADSPYRFMRSSYDGDSLGPDGAGEPVARTGMTWSGFRPSDDRCRYGYLVPSNALASASLHGLAEMAERVLGDPELAVEARALADEIDAGILDHAVVAADGKPPVLAYEVDGLGAALLADDANLPSLLSLPMSGWCADDDPLYLATREFVLSAGNPYFYAGTAAAGVGSPHTPGRHVWPMAVAVEGLTGGDEGALTRALETLAATTGGTGLMHESFLVDDPEVFTRPWFGWANAMFVELALERAGLGVRGYFPVNPRVGAGGTG
jgi:meiotically up-regulated gene 157 (Mug157) protein